MRLPGRSFLILVVVDGRSEAVLSMVQELARHLADRFGVTFEAVIPDADLAGEICELLSAPRLIGLSAYMVDQAVSRFGHTAQTTGVLIVTGSDSAVAQACRKDNPVAQWGANLGRLSVVYGPVSDGVVWHEVMHMFGAEDCYDSKTAMHRAGCTHGGRCLMAYAPESKPSELRLCCRNMDLILARAVKEGILGAW